MRAIVVEHFKRLLAVAIAYIGLFVSAHADTISVKAGSNSTFGPFLVYGKENCDISPPSSYFISTKPKNGKANPVTRKVTLPKDYDVCPGSTGYVLYVTYQPNRGFRGDDRFTLSYSVDRYIDAPSVPRVYHFNIEVK